jgi:ribosomal protein S18 acetylase RimI-like enzyme
LKTVFKEIRDGAELDGLLQEIVSEISIDPDVEMAFPEIVNPSFLLANFSVRDDSKTFAVFEKGTLLGLSSFVLSKQTFLPPSFLNKIFFILRRKKAKNIEDQLIEKVEKAYLKLKVPEISYGRLKPVEPLSPTGRTLGKHGYKKKFSMQRMAKPLNNIQKPKTSLKLSFRRVKWEEQDLLLFMETWARGFNWPAKYIEPSVKGITRRLLERNASDPNMWINFLVELDGKPVGTAAFLTFPKTAYVVNVSTLKEFRRKGIATFAMTCLMEWCKERGIKYMALDVEPDDVAALNLYRKLGFKEFGESNGYVKKFSG